MDYLYEQNLIDQGHQYICGIDEAGRGPLAGPLVAGAVILDPEKNDFFGLLNDSKKMTNKRREEAYLEIINKARCWAIGVVRHGEIDQYGLGFANKIAMKRAWSYLATKPDFIACDHVAKVSFKTPYESIIGGDAKVLSIAAASIIAKVMRDRMMTAFANKYPGYGFAQHKGYGTKFHMDMIDHFGPCEIHRKSFTPIKVKLFP